MRKYSLIVSGIAAVFAGFLYYLACGFPLSKLDDLGPAFWPKILCAALLICAVLQALEACLVYRRMDLPVSFFATKGQRMAWKAVCATVLFVLCIRFLGFYISGAIFLPGMFWLLGERHKGKILILDVAIILAVFILFRILLRVQLPAPVFL